MLQLTSCNVLILHAPWAICSFAGSITGQMFSIQRPRPVSTPLAPPIAYTTDAPTTPRPGSVTRAYLSAIHNFSRAIRMHCSGSFPRPLDMVPDTFSAFKCSSETMALRIKKRLYIRYHLFPYSPLFLSIQLSRFTHNQ